MTNANEFIPPAPGTQLDPSELFGIERREDGMVRAIGPYGQRSTAWASSAVAEALIRDWLPDSEEIALMAANGEIDEALLAAATFVASWDRMAPGTALMHMAWIAMPTPPKMGLSGVAGVQALDDGLVYLGAADGARSVEGLLPEAAVAMMIDWDGLDAAADLASEFADGKAAVAQALLRRWDVEAAARKSTGAA